MSLAQLEEHARVWERKPSLRRVYSVWFDALLDPIPRGGRVLEVGAGPGFLARHARASRPDLSFVAGDLEHAPWNDVAANATALPFGAATFDAVVGLDVVHHLDRPLRFCAEAGRVLRPGGRLAVVEPWVTPLSFPIYRWLHPERCESPADPEAPFADLGGAGKDPFDGNAAVLPALVRAATAESWARCGLRAPEVTLLNGFAYLLTLGFRGPSLLPGWLAPALLKVDERTRTIARMTALRALAVWTRLP